MWDFEFEENHTGNVKCSSSQSLNWLISLFNLYQLEKKIEKSSLLNLSQSNKDKYVHNFIILTFLSNSDREANDILRDLIFWMQMMVIDWC